MANRCAIIFITVMRDLVYRSRSAVSAVGWKNAGSNSSFYQQGAILFEMCLIRGIGSLLQVEYYLNREGYSNCYHNLCVINFPCLGKEINNPVNCNTKCVKYNCLFPCRKKVAGSPLLPKSSLHKVTLENELTL